MTARCSTPETICVQCGDRGFTNAFIYCVKCINVALHRYCLNVIPSTFDEVVRWVCDDCVAEVQNQSVGQCKTKDPSTYSHAQVVLERNLDGNFERHNMLSEDNNIKQVEQAQDQIEWSFKRPEMRGMLPCINLYYKAKVLTLVKTRLHEVGGPQLLHRFEQGCFGHLLGWRNTISCGRALHALISNEIEICDAPKHERWFRVCGNNLRFSHHEYALVSGLNFGASDFDFQREYDVRLVDAVDRFCEGDGKISLLKLWDRFARKERVSPDDDDYLKVANLLVLYFFVLGYGKLRRVNNFAWILVDRLEEWNNFPWGSYSYHVLMHYMDQLPRNKIECGGKYHFFGPVWTLQIWAYEAIPNLAQFVAIVQAPNVVPRCLKWLFIKPKKNDFDDLFDALYSCHERLEPTPVEVQSACWTSAERENALGVVFMAPTNPIYGGSKTVARVLKRSTRSNTEIQQPLTKNMKKTVDKARYRVGVAGKRERKRARSLLASTSNSNASPFTKEQAIDTRIQRAWDMHETEFVHQVKEALLSEIKEYIKFEMLPELKQVILDHLRPKHPQPQPE